MNNTAKALFLAVVSLIMVIMLAGCSRGVVAEVNGEKITETELTQQVNDAKSSYEKQGVDFSGDKGKTYLESLKKDVLDQMISNKLMLQEAKKLGALSPEQVQEKLKPLKEQFPSEEEFKSLLAEVKMTEGEVASILNLQEQVTKDVARPTEAELEKYYNDNKEQFGKPEQLQVRHILFFIDDGTSNYPVKHSEDEARKMAEDAIAQIKQGKDFADLAKEKSEDTGTKPNGGQYTFSKGQAVKEFSDAAYALKAGEYTQQPVKTQYGFHIIKLEKIITASQESYNQVKERLAEQLYDRNKQTKFSQFMQDVKNKAKIVNKLAEKEGTPSKK